MQKPIVQRGPTWANTSSAVDKATENLRVIISGCPSEKWRENVGTNHIFIKEERAQEVLNVYAPAGMWKRDYSLNGVQVKESRRPRSGTDNRALSTATQIENDPITK